MRTTPQLLGGTLGGSTAGLERPSGVLFSCVHGGAAGPPKSGAGRRVIALDKTTVAALREHRFRQQAERAAAANRWAETGYVFTTMLCCLGQGLDAVEHGVEGHFERLGVALELGH